MTTAVSSIFLFISSLGEAWAAQSAIYADIAAEEDWAAMFGEWSTTDLQEMQSAFNKLNRASRGNNGATKLGDKNGQLADLLRQKNYRRGN